MAITSSKFEDTVVSFFSSLNCKIIGSHVYCMDEFSEETSANFQKFKYSKKLPCCFIDFKAIRMVNNKMSSANIDIFVMDDGGSRIDAVKRVKKSISDLESKIVSQNVFLYNGYTISFESKPEVETEHTPNPNLAVKVIDIEIILREN